MKRTEPTDRAGLAASPPPPGAVEVRPLRTHEEFAACVLLQRLTWGDGFADIVPASLLMIGQKVGGVCAGAFDPTGRLVGFVYGLSGVRDGRLSHWSHMLAVEPASRNLGLGRHLKEFQREQLLAMGVEVVYWTFDPLVARNAHLNVMRLGADVVDYIPDMYGRTGSSLHALGTDRLVVEWRIREPRVARVLEAGPAPVPAVATEAPLVAPGGDGTEPSFPPGPVVRIAVPADIDAVRLESEDRALRWRDATRRAFLWYFGRGYRIVGFHGDRSTGTCYYTLSAGVMPGGMS